MKKLYRKGTVHPSPPLISDHLAFLPATILTLTAALSPEDREVLAYLLSGSGASSSATTPFSGHHRKSAGKSGSSVGGGGGGGDHHHPPLFNCSCFGCYTSYWVRWDSSPNRQLIHEIIDSFEEWLVKSSKNQKSKKDRRKRGFVTESESGVSKNHSESRSTLESAEVGLTAAVGGGAEGFGGCCGDDGDEKGSVRKLVSLIGERIWNVWGQ